METADRDRYSRLAETPGDMHGARKLVRLNAHEAEQSAFRRAHVGDQLVYWDDGVGFVIGLVGDLDVRPEDMPLGAIARQTVEAAE